MHSKDTPLHNADLCRGAFLDTAPDFRGWCGFSGRWFGNRGLKSRKARSYLQIVAGFSRRSALLWAKDFSGPGAFEDVLIPFFLLRRTKPNFGSAPCVQDDGAGWRASVCHTFRGRRMAMTVAGRRLSRAGSGLKLGRALPAISVSMASGFADGLRAVR